MAAQIVYDGAAGGGQLFAGKKFFFTQKVPQRNRWIELFKVCLPSALVTELVLVLRLMLLRTMEVRK